MAASKQHGGMAEIDDDVCEILQATSKGGTDKKLRALTAIIISFAPERFYREADEWSLQLKPEGDSNKEHPSRAKNPEETT